MAMSEPGNFTAPTGEGSGEPARVPTGEGRERDEPTRPPLGEDHSPPLEEWLPDIPKSGWEGGALNAGARTGGTAGWVMAGTGLVMTGTGLVMAGTGWIMA